MLRDAALLALDKGRWELFGAFVRFLPPELGHRAVATLLSLEVGSEELGPDRQEYDRWRAWLIRERWQNQGFVETALLLSGDHRLAGDGLPTLELAKAAAVCGMKDYPGDRSVLLLGAYDCKKDPDQAVAWSCIATLELLVRAVSDANDVLRELEPQVPDPWKDWNSLLMRFWQKEGQAIPLERLEARRKEHTLRDEQNQAHTQLLDAIAKLDQIMSGFHFTVGKWAKEELMRPEGRIGRLLGLVESQDIAGTAGWLKALRDDRLDKGEAVLAWVEPLVHQRNPSLVRNKHIEGTRRQRCVSAIDQIIGSAQDWAARSEKLAAVDEEHYLETRALALGREIEERIAAIEVDPDHPDRIISRPVFEAMKTSLEVLWTQT